MATQITTNIQNCYNNFIKNMLATTGLPISEMQTLTEWVENRKADFEDSSANEKFLGFNYWLSQRYL